MRENPSNALHVLFYSMEAIEKHMKMNAELTVRALEKKGNFWRWEIYFSNTAIALECIEALTGQASEKLKTKKQSLLRK